MSYQMKQYIVKMFSIGNDGLSREQWIIVTFIGFGFGLLLLLGSGTKRNL